MQLKNILLKKIKEIGLLNKVNFIIIYGSYSKGNQTPLSDVDICISLSSSPKDRLKARIKLLGGLSDNYDIQIFEDLPLYVQKEILSGDVLYCKNRKKLMAKAFKVITDYEDFQPIYERYISGVVI